MIHVALFPDRIRVRITPQACGALVLRPVSERWTRRFQKVVVQNGGPDEDTAYLTSLSELEGSLPRRHLRDLEQGWHVTVLMDPWTVGMYYGHDAHTACERKVENPVALLEGA